MAFASMNGRLRSIPSNKNANVNINCNWNGNGDEHLSFSTIPCTLPHGLLTIHNGRPGPKHILNSSSSCIDDDDDDDHRRDQEKIMMRKTYDEFGIAEIHRTMGDIIIDHCWVKVKLKVKLNPTVNENNNGNDLKIFLVLAMLTRRREKTILENDDNMAVTMLHVYWRELNSDSYGYSDGGGDGAESGQNDDDDGSSIDETFPTNNKRSLTFPCMVNNVVMNESILVVGSSAGATVYSVQEILRVQSDERNRNDDDTIMESDSQTASMSLRKNHHDGGLRNLKLMTTFIVHAMDISQFHFVAVSGNRVGVWNVQKLKQALYMDTNMDDKTKTSQHIQKNPTAEWSTKVEGKMGRITCADILKADTVEQDAKYIALVDWNGSAFVFRRQDNGISQWQRVRQPQSELSDSIKQDVSEAPFTIGNDDIVPSWEESASSKNYHRGHNNNQNVTAPTFATICEINLPGLKDTVPVMALSTPGHNIISIYDLDRQCLWTDTRTIADANNCGEVQGLVSFTTTHQHDDDECSRDIILTSVDDSDRITQINLSSWLNRIGNIEA